MNIKKRKDKGIKDKSNGYEKNESNVYKKIKDYSINTFNNEITVILLIVIISAVWASLHFTPLLYSGGDNARYILLGKAILEGKFMIDTSLYGEPIHTVYPPLFPVLISIVLKLFGHENIIALKIFLVFIYILSCVFIYLLFKLYFNNNRKFAMIMVLLFVIFNEIVKWSSIILTEMIFIFFIIISLYYFKKYDMHSNKKDLIILLVISTFSTYLRGNGIIIFGALFFYLVIKRRYREIMYFLIPFGIASQIWSFYIRFIAKLTPEYFEQIMYKNWYMPHEGYIDFVYFFIRIYFNIISYFAVFIPQIVNPFYNYKPQYLAYPILLSILIVYSLYIAFKSKMIFELIFFLMSLSMLLIWPDNWAGDRFIAPYFSLIMIFVGTIYYRYQKKAYIKIFFSVCVLLIILLNLIYFSKIFTFYRFMQVNATGDYRKDIHIYEHDLSNLYSVALWAESNTPKDAVFTSVKPHLFSLFSERKCEIFPYTDDSLKIRRFFAEKDISYIVYRNDENPHSLVNFTINRYLLKYPDEFTLEYIDEMKPYFLLLKIYDKSKYFLIDN